MLLPGEEVGAVEIDAVAGLPAGGGVGEVEAVDLAVVVKIGGEGSGCGELEIVDIFFGVATVEAAVFKSGDGEGEIAAGWDGALESRPEAGSGVVILVDEGAGVVKKAEEGVDAAGRRGFGGKKLARVEAGEGEEIDVSAGDAKRFVVDGDRIGAAEPIGIDKIVLVDRTRE